MIHVRKADRRDAPFIVMGNQSMARETEGKTLDSNRLSAGVHGLFDRPQYGFYVVAEMNGRLAAQMMITYEWSDWRNRLFWWIQSVFVLPEFRRRGLYSHMHAWVEELAQREQACGLRLYVEKNNAAAKHTYHSCGMKPSPYDLFEQSF